MKRCRRGESTLGAGGEWRPELRRRDGVPSWGREGLTNSTQEHKEAGPHGWPPPGSGEKEGILRNGPVHVLPLFPHSSSPRQLHARGMPLPLSPPPPVPLTCGCRPLLTWSLRLPGPPCGCGWISLPVSLLSVCQPIRQPASAPRPPGFSATCHPAPPVPLLPSVCLPQTGS